MKNRIIGLMVVMLGLSSCFHAHVVPSDAVPRRTKLDQDVFGGYIKITCRDSTRYEGELIGIRNDSVIFLPALANQPRVPVIKAKAISLARPDIAKAMVIIYNPAEYGWAYLGILTTPSNGPFLVLTAPLWIIASTSAVAGEDTPNYKSFPAKPIPTKGAPELVSEEQAWKEILKYSRFPQGVPDNIRLTDLKGRPK